MGKIHMVNPKINTAQQELKEWKFAPSSLDNGVNKISSVIQVNIAIRWMPEDQIAGAKPLPEPLLTKIFEGI